MTTTKDLTVWDVLEQQLRTEIALTWNPEGPVVLAIDSEKGGVGKSGLAGGLIAVMAASGRRVLGIDLDPRATLTAELGADTESLLKELGEEGPEATQYGVNDLLYEDREADPDDLPQLSGLAEVALRPASKAWGNNVRVLAAERALANREDDNATPALEHRLRISLEGVAEQFDLVVIDLPPRAGGKLVGAGLLAATHVLFPGTLNEDGLVGVRDAMRTYKFMARANPTKLRRVGVLRNIVEPKTKLAKYYDDKFSEEFGAEVITTAVPKRVIRQEARGACVPITAAADKSDAKDLINSYTRVLNAVGSAV
ncbi:ParA family protein [Amycolatopsis sp. NPDC051903]|uniref:ParA family protein n=1 Tax=Amycolatopsis sp. NPDC051903 TaxID=3363936 RepID=UPI003787FF7D